MKKLIRLPVFILTITFSLVPIALRAQDRAPMAGPGGAAMVRPDVSASGSLFSEMISPDQTISMDLQEANLRDVLKIFSMQSGLNFISSDAVENKKVTLYLDKVPIKLAMDKLFDTNKLTYEFDEDAGIFVVRGKEEDVDLVTEIFRLKYRSVLTSNMEKQRTGLFTGESIGGGSGVARTTAAEVSDIKTTIQQMLSKVGKVSEDNKTNSLIVTDVPSRFPPIRTLIATLDVPQAQVMLDVEMLDVNKDLIDKMGFNFENGSLMRLSVDLASKGLAFPFSTGGFKSGGEAGASLLTRSPGSINFGDDALGSAFGVTFDMLKKDTDTRLLARPRILTLNNETAEIGITKDEIVSSTTTITEDAGGTPRTEYTYNRASSLSLTPEGIGVFLRVTPMINEETGEITLVVNPKSSTTTQSDLAPTLSRDPEVRASKSIIKVRDGETVVLGGLIKMEKQAVKSKIPVFGDIPILGMLFRGKDVSKNQERELLVFITPHIIRDESAPLSARKPAKAPTGQNKQRSQANRVTLFTRHEAVNTALNNLDDR
jgi:type II secretory pathway component GspD/PulD (secretin)